MRRQSRRICLGLLLPLLFLVLLPHESWGLEGGLLRLSGRYPELQEAARRGPFGLPLQVRSEERETLVSAEIHGIIGHPFRALAATFTDPGGWCNFLVLNPNIKTCTFRREAQETLLTLYIGSKSYRAPESATEQVYRFLVRARHPEYAAISLTAPRGLLGTTAHRFEFEAGSVAGKTVVTLSSSFEPSMLSKLLTGIYLSTLGRDRIGFSREATEAGVPAGYVRGVKGMIERNVMRYYLALKAFLDTSDQPADRQFEARASLAYDLMDLYPAQLRQMEKAEYLEIKSREHQ
ncbi:MAG: hypothetical protein WCI75_12355, partial [candidate division NC10 bacterium]